MQSGCLCLNWKKPLNINILDHSSIFLTNSEVDCIVFQANLTAFGYDPNLPPSFHWLQWWSHPCTVSFSVLCSQKATFLVIFSSLSVKCYELCLEQYLNHVYVKLWAPADGYGLAIYLLRVCLCHNRPRSSIIFYFFFYN